MRRHAIATAGGLVLAALVLLALSGATPATAGARPAAATPPPAADALLRELAERLLTPPGGPPGQPLPTPQLRPGALPADLPLALPVPPGGRLVGSVARRAGGTLVGAEVVVDAPGAAADTAAFYERALGPQGWTPAALGGPGPPFGFQPSGAATFRSFCAPPGAPGSLNLQVLATTAGPGDLRLRLDLTNPGPCGQRPGEPPRPGLPPGAERLPLLSAPDGAQVTPGGGGGGGNRFASDALAATALPVAALHDAYAAQLAAAGWTRVAGGADGPLAWSTWRLPGAGAFVGFLYVLQGAGERQRELHVQAAAPYPGGPGGTPPPAPPGPAPTAPAPPTPAERLIQPTRTTLVPATP